MDLYADVNLSEALSLDTNDWNVLFLLPLTDFYMYIVFMWFVVLNVRGIVFARFLSLFVSLFLCQQHYEKTAGPICMKFSGKVWSDHGTT